MNKPIESLCRTAVVAGLLLASWPASADLIHRYNFDLDANDSVGTAHGQVQAVTSSGGTPPAFVDGQQVYLDGVGGYIDLPNGIISSLTDVSIEAWVTWFGGGAWQRLFDFGNTTTGEQSASGGVGTGTSYMFLCFNAANNGNLRWAITDNANGGSGNDDERPVLNDPAATPVSDPLAPPYTEVYVTVTYSSTGEAKLYVNGQLVDSDAAANPIPLSAIDDVNNWIGRSQWADPAAFISVNDFRIHDSVLSGPEIAASSINGPDVVDYNAGEVTSPLNVKISKVMFMGEDQTPSYSTTYSIIGDVAVSPAVVTLTSSNPGVVEVLADGTLASRSLGSATITATLDGITVTTQVRVVVPKAEIAWIAEGTAADSHPLGNVWFDLLKENEYRVSERILNFAGDPTPLLQAIAGDPTPEQQADLNTFDLVIYSRKNNSGNWNNQTLDDTITVPFISMSAYLTRDNRWQWVTGDGVPDATPETIIANQPDHPIFTGIELVDGTTGPWFTTMGPEFDRGTTLAADPPVAGGILIASAAEGNVVMEFPAGTVSPGHRLAFFGGVREPAASPDERANLHHYGKFNLTESGTKAYINAVKYMLGEEITDGGGEEPTISVSFANGSVVVTFTGTLLSADNVAGPYTPVAGASSPRTVTPDQAARFYQASN